ncbi:hypothetical protein OEB99_16370 [Actinotalea sp. M2MS4P-6]|uniref:hypothetical protein n=1 Tax=Actinotalea sp. M2MS4P-6 TaxID=2983762 RepID=UPI0021E4E705|nr:hypothetical protein [Actinotalea sp. M2MS4P-6]MCV2395891.1 hypothetical protein [Actinotalea sp. M2MS4P-6]
MSDDPDRAATLRRLLRLGYRSAAIETIESGSWAAGELGPGWAVAALALSDIDELGTCALSPAELDATWHYVVRDAARPGSHDSRDMTPVLIGRFPRTARQHSWTIPSEDPADGTLTSLGRWLRRTVVLRISTAAYFMVAGATLLALGFLSLFFESIGNTIDLGFLLWVGLFGVSLSLLATSVATQALGALTLKRIQAHGRLGFLPASRFRAPLAGAVQAARRRRYRRSQREPGGCVVLPVRRTVLRRAVLLGLTVAVVPVALAGGLLTLSLVLGLLSGSLDTSEARDLGPMAVLFGASVPLLIWMYRSPRLFLPRAIPSRLGWGLRRAKAFPASVLELGKPKSIVRAAMRACASGAETNGLVGEALLLRSFEDDAFEADNLLPAGAPIEGRATAPAAAVLACAGWFRLRMVAPPGAAAEGAAAHEDDLEGRALRRFYLKHLDILGMFSSSLPDDTWEEEVETLARTSDLILVSLGYSPGITTEIELLRRIGATSRTVFLFTSFRQFQADDADRLLEVLGVSAAAPELLSGRRPLALCLAPEPTLFVTSPRAVGSVSKDLEVALECAIRLVHASSADRT